MEVIRLRWPAEEPRRRQLAETGIPRLLLVTAPDPPPLTTDPLEDWVRLPAPDVDVLARQEVLLQRAGTDTATVTVPVIDADGLVHTAKGWVPVPPVEARLAARLIDGLGTVVSREELIRTAWPDEVVKRNLLDVRILRLRRRVEQIGLTIKTVRSRGYIMECVV